MALTANPFAMATTKEVLWRKFVTAFAMRLTGTVMALFVGRILLIVCIRAQKQMCRIDATSHVAAMADEKAGGYRAMYKRVGQPVSCPNLFALSNLAVSVRIQ